MFHSIRVIGNLLDTIGFDGAVLFLDARSLEEVARITHQYSATSLCWAAIAGRPALACIYSDGKVRIWKLDASYLPSKTSRATVVHADSLSPHGLLTFDNKNNLLAIASAGQFNIWSLEKKRTLFAGVQNAHTDCLDPAAIPRGGLRYTLDDATIAYIKFATEDDVLCVFYTPHGKLLVYACRGCSPSYDGLQDPI